MHVLNFPEVQFHDAFSLLQKIICATRVVQSPADHASNTQHIWFKNTIHRLLVLTNIMKSIFVECNTIPKTTLFT